MDEDKRNDDAQDLCGGNQHQNDEPGIDPHPPPATSSIVATDSNAGSNSTTKNTTGTGLALAAPSVFVEQVGNPAFSLLSTNFLSQQSYLLLTLDQPVISYFDSHPQKPTRVVVFLRPNSPLFSLPYEEVVRLTCATVSQPYSKSLFLTIQIWPQLTILIFELYHDAYDWSTAHQAVDLPALLVDYGRKRAYARVAGPETRTLAKQYVARQHDSHGWDARPPYLQDQTGPTPPRYYNARRKRYAPGVSPDTKTEGNANTKTQDAKSTSLGS
ncbi:MAG: hypothetical protein M1817_001363 [Caeruleum heppii]|nr:MAG: hypothetical protein M1817_001363 [Caeruleum heppii]